MYVVIMAGGGGTRLWPLSTPERPKPFLPLLADETLLQRTVDRVRPLGPTRISVVAAAAYADLVRAQVPDAELITEPEGRNTAAAIALATVAIDRPWDEVMAVLPADHTIEREDVFAEVIEGAATHLATGALGVEDPLVTLGIRMDRPATEYGYLRPILPGAVAHGQWAYRLEAFIEKPDAKRAAALYEEGAGIAWNAGMFLWRRRAIHAALRDFAPDILGEIHAGVGRGGTGLAAAYERLRATSIDYAVMEPAAGDGRVVMGSMDVGWSDLGSWTQLLEALGVGGVEGRVVQAGATDTASADDLLVRRVDGRLVLEAGPRQGILDATGPSAILARGRPHRATVEALLARCQPGEPTS